MSAPHIILASLPSLCQKLSKLVEIWWSSDENNFDVFFETRCVSTASRYLMRSGSRNRWRSWNNEVTWSYLLEPFTRRAAAWSTDCSRPSNGRQQMRTQLRFAGHIASMAAHYTWRQRRSLHAAGLLDAFIIITHWASSQIHTGIKVLSQQYYRK